MNRSGWPAERESMGPRPGRPLLLALFEAAVGRAFTPALPIPAGEIDWAIQTGLGPLLHATLEHQPEMIPAPLAMRVRAADRLARFESAERLEATAEILDRCGDRAGPITLLKGISICTEHYARPHDRAMGDLDLLVEAKGVPAIQSALAELGYRPAGGPVAQDYSDHHHTRPQLHPRTGVCVEVHTGLFPPRTGWVERPPFSLSSIRAEQRPGSFAGRGVHRLSPELQLVYIATHSALVFQPAAGARALLDTLLLLRNAGERLDWDRVCGWLEDRRIAAHLQLITSYLERHGLVPAHVELSRARASLAALGRIELRILDRIIHRYRVRGLPLEDRLGANNRAIVWSTLIAAPRSPWNVARIPWNLLFPPSHPDRFQPRYQLERVRSALFPES